MDTLIEILISSIPILLLIGVWVYFMRGSRKFTNTQADFQAKVLEQMERQTEVMERQTEALEKISNRP